MSLFACLPSRSPVSCVSRRTKDEEQKELKDEVGDGHQRTQLKDIK